MNFGWAGETPNKGTLYAYLVNVANNGMPVSWKSQSTPVAYTINDNQSVSPAIALTPGVAMQSIGGTLDRSGFAVTQLFLSVTPNGGGTGKITFLNQNHSIGTFSAPILTASTGGIVLGGVINGASIYAWKANIAPGTMNVALKLPTSVTALAQPPAAQTGVDFSTMFSWDGPFSTYMFRVFCGLSSPRTFFAEVITTKKNATIFDANGLGAALPSGSSCVWQVSSFAGPQTMDDAVKPAGWTRYLNFSDFIADGGYSTAGRPFTSK